MYICIWLLPLRIMILRVIYIACISGLFLFVAEQVSLMQIYHNLFIHSPVGGHLSCSHCLAITNKAAVNICVLIFV